MYIGKVVLPDLFLGHNPNQLQNTMLGSHPDQFLPNISPNGQYNAIGQQRIIGVLAVTEKFQ